MNVTIVYNSKSGSALPKRQLKQLFIRANITVDHMIDISVNAAAIPTYATRGETIAVIGGDGTISSVAGMVINSPATLVPLPGGTLNHFTKDLGVNQDLATAILSLPTKTTTMIDVASVNGTVFINNSSIGIYPSSLTERKRFEDKLGKWPAAVVSITRTLVRYRRYSVDINDTIYTTPFVFIGNNKYDLTQAAQRVSLRRGKLCVYVVTANRRRDLLWLLLTAIAGQLHTQDGFTEYDITTATISSVRRSKINVSRDGEVGLMQFPLEYKMLPKKLKVII